ncbi:response regulator [Pseudanabaena sp. FACHB-1277]|uniref:Response regulator n=1 Tax=Pseudanabaena cinerea FACHB-1277 TaxID=2949581 RepID=A0A926Z7R8_9CYAN|nr:response regulator [Pseudanabaena cinerea]MBD2152002.1 response regulator [Pseudanabaena cinerea FACHB-1277]
MKILVVEDDEVLVAVLTKSLTAHHYVVDVVKDGEMGWIYGSTFEYDLIVLDIVLPKIDGLCLCQRLRTEGYTTPILLLTSQNASTAKVIGLDAGADDYVVKPFDVAELIARIRALLRRSQTSSLPLLVWGELLLNPSTCEVSYDGQALTLTNKEYELLELLLRDSQHLLSADEILDRLWSSDEFPSEATVRSHIRRLRHKLVAVGAPSDFIATVHGRGYYLKAPNTGNQHSLANSTKLAADAHAPSQSQPSQQQQYLEFLNQLWLTTKPKSLEQLDLLWRSLRKLRVGGFDAQGQRQAQEITHKLAGTLGTMGLTLAMQLSRQLETLFTNPELLKKQVEKHLLEILESLVKGLEQTIQNTEVLHSIPISGVTGSNLAIAGCQDSPRVMIVDDDVDYLRSLPKLLQPWGFKVTTLADTKDFWQVLDLVLPDILVLDVNMPQINGLELCQALRDKQTWQRLPILFLSVLSDANTQNLAFSVGADDYICKPIVGIDLANRIHNRLKRVQSYSN